MEFASYLAGERWSDHPPCTSPLLAAAARLVNDFTSDDARQKLVPLIPRVIGLSSTDPDLNVRVVVHAAAAALPVASMERQRALGVGLLTCARLSDDPDLAGEIDDAFASAPDSRRWALEFVDGQRLTADGSALRRGSEAMVRLAVLGIAFACIPDADERLYALLERLIEDFETAQTAPVEPVPAAREFATSAS